MTNYLLDTNHLIKLLRGDDLVRVKLEEGIMRGDRIHISAFAYYETRRGYIAANRPEKLPAFDAQCDQFPLVFLVSRSALDIASRIYGDLYKAGSVIQDADILIASSAIELGYTVCTTDESDYSRIPTVQIENWAVPVPDARATAGDSVTEAGP